MPTFEIPPVMTDPDLLAPGDSWKHSCDLRIYAREADPPRSRACGVVAQGGIEGLKAHIRTVHG